MSAKLLHALSDENPELKRQIGCMTGIFQLFDRHHILPPKRITSHKRPPSGNSRVNNSSHGDECHIVNYQHTPTEKNPNKNVSENRLSMESARDSFSSSTCSSSFSSVECNKVVQSETSFDQAIRAELASKESSSMQANGCAQIKKSFDFREVVKDSMYKDSHSLSVKTTAKEEPVTRIMKHRDSPRPLPLQGGSTERGVGRVPIDLKDSLNVLTKHQEAPRYVHHDTREPSRSPYETREGTFFSVPKDRRRNSYDGREMARTSFESRDAIKSTAKLRELPRLSLDSRASSMRESDSDDRSSSFLREFGSPGGNSNRASSAHQGLEVQKQNHSVVAKLMGLEAMPKTPPPFGAQGGVAKTSFYHSDNHDSCSRSSRETSDSKQNCCSPRSSIKELVSPRLRNLEPVAKALPNSRVHIEPAPWGKVDGGHGIQKPIFRSHDSSQRGPNASPSVYAEIEKRLKELEFKQSDKDLRALKQILDAMEAKGLLDTKKKGDREFASEGNYDDLKHNNLDQNSRLTRLGPINTFPVSSAQKGTSPPRMYESPIVIMKPAKYIQKSGIPASSIIPLDGIPNLRRIRSGTCMDSKKSLVNSQMAKEITPKPSIRESVKKTLNSANKKGNVGNTRPPNSPTRFQESPRENIVSIERSSGSVSPRMQQKKFDTEKQCHPPSSSSDLSKPRKINVGHSTDPGSPGGKRRPKSPNSGVDQLSESGKTRNTGRQGAEVSVRSDSNVSVATQMDGEVTSTDRSGDIHNAFFHQGSRSPSRKVVNNAISSLKHKKLSPSKASEDGGSVVEFTTVAPEQPSPVSVLDASFYSDDVQSPDSREIDHGTEINRKKLENVDQLVQKLRRLNSNHDEATTDYIASLCENTNPDHRYISEILLASGLLLRDLGSGFATIQLHKSGHPINPDLFLVLEQTKMSNGIVKDRNWQQLVQSKTHRKLVFDSVNEILEEKLASTQLCHRPYKLAGRKLNGQLLLKELCSEIEQLQANENSDGNFDDEDDFLKTILCRDVMSPTEKWIDFREENSGIVLDVERLIFKDLIDETITGEVFSLRAKPSRHCRQLFSNCRVHPDQNGAEGNTDIGYDVNETS